MSRDFDVLSIGLTDQIVAGLSEILAGEFGRYGITNETSREGQRIAEVWAHKVVDALPVAVRRHGAPDELAESLTDEFVPLLTRIEALAGAIARDRQRAARG